MNSAQLQTYVRLHLEKDALEAQVKDLKEQMAQLEPVLMDQFTQDSTQSVKVNVDSGGRATVYVERKLWAKVVDGDTERAVAHLKLAGPGWCEFVKEGYNSNTLSARLRELEKQGESLPASLVGVIDTSEVFSLRVRKA